MSVSKTTALCKSLNSLVCLGSPNLNFQHAHHVFVTKFNKNGYSWALLLPKITHTRHPIPKLSFLFYLRGFEPTVSISKKNVANLKAGVFNLFSKHTPRGVGAASIQTWSRGVASSRAAAAAQHLCGPSLAPGRQQHGVAVAPSPCTVWHLSKYPRGMHTPSCQSLP